MHHGLLRGLEIILLLVACAPISVSEPDSLHAPLRVGGPLSMAPLAYVDSNGSYTGFSVDILHRIWQTQSAGDTLLFFPFPSEYEALQALKQDQIDCVHSIRQTIPLMDDFVFIGPYLETPSMLFVAASTNTISQVKDLANHVVLVSPDDPALSSLKNVKRITIRMSESLEDGFSRLKEGKVDAFIAERLTALRMLGEKKWEQDFKMVGEPLGLNHFGWVSKKANRSLINRLQSGLTQIDQNGQQERLFRQWFGEEIQPQVPLARRVIRWGFVFVGGSLLVTMIVLGWNVLLQRELDLKAIAIEKTKLDQTISEEKSRFEAIVQSMTEGLMLITPDGHIAYVNARGAYYLGRRVEDLVGRPLHSLKDHLLTQTQERDSLARRLDYAENHPQRPMLIEYSVMTTRRQDLHFKFFPVRDRQGAFAGRGMLIEDVTHEREIERLKSEFVSIASHELRTPMTSIFGFSEIMLTQELSGEVYRHYTEQIHQEAARLTRILNDMLDLSYLESGEGILAKKTVTFDAIVRQVAESYQAQLKGSRELLLHLPSEPCMIHADPDKITQVLWNLVSNADKYSYEGKAIEVTLRQVQIADPLWGLSREETDSLLPAAELTVVDFGQGIPPEHLSLIFVPFHRVETAVHTIRGTGLGLAIVKRIVEAHLGKVWVQSEPGKQTVFTVLLPLRPFTPTKQNSLS
jgi:PAS domain S-box-containing protein